MKRKLLQLAVLLLLAGAIAGAAIADSYNSPSKVTTLGSNTLVWTGQGTTGGVLNTVLCGDQADAQAPDPNNYLLWIFGFDAATLNDPPAPTLHLGGSGSGDYTGTAFGNEYHIFTPFFSLSSLTANVSFDVATLGSGSFVLTISHGCPAASAETSSVATTVHSGATDSDPSSPVIVDDANPASLGDSVHDSAHVEFTGGGTLPSGSTVQFLFFKNHDCSLPSDDSSSAIDVSGDSSPIDLDPNLAEGPLAAGQYSYRAAFTSGDETTVTSSVSDCEPFTVNKADLGISTDIHNAAHAVVTSVAAGSIVHDTATLSGAVAGFDPDLSQVSFIFFTNGTCTPDGGAVANGTPESTYVARSADSAPLSAGHYSYQASYAGDSNYNPAGPSDCEPLTVFQLGLTMGFWGNKNGVARINGAGGYVANAVNIGRGANIDTQAESLKVLPNTLNACGKGSPIIFSDQTLTKNCSLATGVNFGSLNTLAAQTLALGYNIKLVSGYTGQTIGDLSCSPVGALTSSSTVNDAFTAAVALINGSASGGTTTQSSIGAMNQLLGCLNREA